MKLVVEDIIQSVKIRNLIIVEKDWVWPVAIRRGSFFSFSFFGSYRKKWIYNRSEDIVISHWRSRIVMTNRLLHRRNLSACPLCNSCHVDETCDHVLLSCVNHEGPRDILFCRLKLLCDCSYSDVICAFLSSHGWG